MAVLVPAGALTLPDEVMEGTPVAEGGVAVTGIVEVAVLSVVPGMGSMVMIPSLEELWAAATATMAARRVTVENFMVDMSVCRRVWFFG